MATIEELSAALVKADAAGDAAGAKVLADHIRSMNAAPAQSAKPAASPDGGVSDSSIVGALAGIGSGVGNVAMGAQHYLGKGLDAIGAGKAGQWLVNDAAQGRAKLKGEVAPYKEKSPIATGGGELAGEIAATLPVGGILGKGVIKAAPLLSRVGVSAPVVEGVSNALATSGFRAGTISGKANLAARTVGGAVTGGASAGLVDPSGAGIGALVGGALPSAAKVAGKAGGVIRNALAGQAVPEEVANLAMRAKELGIDVPADRITNSKPLNAIASSLNYVPFSGRAATEKNMESGLNRALSRTFGQDSDNVTGALRKANDVLGAEFDDVLKSNTVRVDDALMGRLGEIEKTADRELGADGMKAIKGQISELLEKGATGEIDGQAAYNIKRTLDRISQRNTPEAFHAREMKSALMDALDRSIGPEQAAAFAKTRQQYGNMLALEKIAKNGAEGDISVARMANMKNINNRDLQELADIAAQFVKARESNHGAMQRAVAGGVGATAAMNGVVPGAGLLAGAAAGRGANMALNSNILKNALIKGPSPASATTNSLLQAGYKAAPILWDR